MNRTPSIGVNIHTLSRKESEYAKELALMSVDYGQFVETFIERFDGKEYGPHIDNLMRSHIQSFLYSLLDQRFLSNESIDNLTVHIHWTANGMYTIRYNSNATPPELEWTLEEFLLLCRLQTISMTNLELRLKTK